MRNTSNFRFQSATEFGNNLVAAHLTKANVELDAPIAIGAAVLDISKTIMYKLAYESFPHYESLFNCKLNILGGDTDSFFFEAVNIDLINFLYPMMKMDGLLDTSNYDKNHHLFNENHKAELGCIKDEFAGHACKEFVLLRPKSYSMKLVNDKMDKKKTKGVPRRKVKMFTHKDFVKVFLDQLEVSTNCRRMQSIKHTVYNVENTKIALSYADDKRAWFSNNFSLPYGHKDAEYYENNPPNEFELTSSNPPRTVKRLHDEIFEHSSKRFKDN
jgi:hypothetical protein